MGGGARSEKDPSEARPVVSLARHYHPVFQIFALVYPSALQRSSSSECHKYCKNWIEGKCRGMGPTAISELGYQSPHAF